MFITLVRYILLLPILIPGLKMSLNYMHEMSKLEEMLYTFNDYRIHLEDKSRPVRTAYLLEIKAKKNLWFDFNYTYPEISSFHRELARRFMDRVEEGDYIVIVNTSGKIENVLNKKFAGYNPETLSIDIRPVEDVILEYTQEK